MNQVTPETDVSPWYKHRTLSVAWLLVLAPVGLFALWRGMHFETRTRWIVTGAVVVLLLLFLGGPTFETILLLVAWPAALFLLWRDRSVLRRTFFSFAGVYAVFVPAVPVRSSAKRWYRNWRPV